MNIRPMFLNIPRTRTVIFDHSILRCRGSAIRGFARLEIQRLLFIGQLDHEADWIVFLYASTTRPLESIARYRNIISYSALWHFIGISLHDSEVLRS